MRFVPEPSPLLRLTVLAAGVLAGAGFACARLWPRSCLQIAHCPWRDLTGWPCPTCGGTHAVVDLAQGRWAEAWVQNPLVALGAAAGLVAVAWALAAALLPSLRLIPRLGPRENRAARLGTALAVLACWAYLLARAHCP